jgi:hypothetical protein
MVKLRPSSFSVEYGVKYTGKICCRSIKFKHDSDDAIVEFANKIFTIDAKLTLTKGNTTKAKESQLRWLMSLYCGFELHMVFR